ncbi:hypothetical protein [Bradyrhizobium sp. Leo121]|uniref:hypothetical protein n=1 Tax=Bradyrhizobium sp. Leo121 TaxID=1571195 RepID=UPI00102A3216|nr:hypothetical protein [Bradyrhizobium sp. Leo121]
MGFELGEYLGIPDDLFRSQADVLLVTILLYFNLTLGIGRPGSHPDCDFDLRKILQDPPGDLEPEDVVAEVGDCLHREAVGLELAWGT